MTQGGNHDGLDLKSCFSVSSGIKLGLASPDEANAHNLKRAVLAARGSWAPYIESVPADPEGYVWHAFAVYKDGRKDREGRYKAKIDASLAAKDYAYMLNKNDPDPERVFRS